MKLFNLRTIAAIAVLLTSFVTVFFTSNPSSSQAITQDCTTVSGTSQPGSNCLIYGMPLCQTIPGATYSINSANIYSSGSYWNDQTKHRVNCADIVDLPICSILSGNGITTSPLKNCVKECSDPSFTDPDPSRSPANVRGQDYAIHNRDCLRFCDNPETGFSQTLVPYSNCVPRLCHQMESAPVAVGTAPNPATNCTQIACNMLVPNELNATKFANDYATNGSQNYCRSTGLKCLNFTQAQLPYVIINAECQMHQCRVSCVDSTTDDLQQIFNKGNSYTSSYRTYIDQYLPTTSDPGANDSLCIPRTCLPILHIPYACSGADQTIPNVLCDTSGSGNICSNGSCYKTLDCNTNQTDQNCRVDSGGSNVIDDSTVHSWFFRPRPMNPSSTDNGAVNGNGVVNSFRTNANFTPGGVCYTESQMQSHSWEMNNRYINIDFGLLGTLRINNGYWHTIFQESFSPGMCSVDRVESRGSGAAYLCEMKGNIWNTPASYTAYHNGYVDTTYTDSEGTHTLTVCLRFNNAFALDRSCGQRECALTCMFGGLQGEGSGCSQACGSDICRTMTVYDSNPYACMMNSDHNLDTSTTNLSDSGTGYECAKTVDGYLRIRAVKFGQSICTFLDIKGTTAYNPIYANGDETLSLDNTTYCASGTYSDGCSGKFNTNNNKGLADRWRTFKWSDGSTNIPYILNNQPFSKPQGYLDHTSRLFIMQNCIKIIQRIGTPKIYNLGSISNSLTLFIPPLYILTSSIKRGGVISPPSLDQAYGNTDFHYPELTAQFGSNSQKLSLGFGYTGYEDGINATPDPSGSATITTSITDTITYSTEVFVRKEYEELSNKPNFCLYQKVKDPVTNAYLNPLRIGCVYRNYPDINNSSDKTITPSIDFRKMVITDPGNTYDSANISVRYLSSSVNNDTCGSASASCSPTLTLTNSNASIPTCDSSIENYRICVQREVCTKLNNECIKNEINLSNAISARQPTDSYVAIQTNCNTTLLTYCNRKFGITSSATATILNPNPNGAAGESRAYGWFNEICISSGFEAKLKRVVAYQTNIAPLGQCVIDTAKQTAANCSSGGNSAAGCPCLEYIDGVTLPIEQISRTQTPHEAGLCINITLPQLCPIINHNPQPNTDITDPNYINSSLNQTTYGTTLTQSSDVINLSHKIRAIGLGVAGGVSNTFGISDIPIAGHADFPAVVFGVNNVNGTCTGFWKNAVNVSNGGNLVPMMNCLNSGGTSAWDTANLTNACIRYSCPAITTTGPDGSGNYQGGYGQLETGESKGCSNGFATWPSFTKTNDLLESRTATSCIPGFKANGASATFSDGTASTTTQSTIDSKALYQKITGYINGNLPTRPCNQLGQWSAPSNVCSGGAWQSPAPTNACIRISCSAINPPSSPASNADWTLWANSGGATFPTTYASRSNSSAQAGSTSTGTCNTGLGFFQALGAAAPTRNCDYLGNWQAVQNACVTRCNAVTDLSNPSANNANNGYAYWNEVTNVAINGSVATTATGCISGYVRYPYAPLKKSDGTAYTLTSGTANYSTTIPQNIANDTRAAGMPQRICQSVITSGGQANVWTQPSSNCTNTCPGSDVDIRIGVGVTRHPVYNGAGGRGTVDINWPSTPLGQTAYVYGTVSNGTTTSVASTSTAAIPTGGSSQQQDASGYYYNRTNGYYAMKRVCNANGTWSPPIMQCVTNGGTFPSSGLSGDQVGALWNGDIRADVNTTSATGTCPTGSYPVDSSGDVIIANVTNRVTGSGINCRYTDANNYIDQTYLKYEATTDNIPCKKKCTSSNGNTYGGGAIDNASGTRYYAKDYQLMLSCRNLYGSAVDGSGGGAFADCGRSTYGLSSDRSDTRPSVYCQADGNWGSIQSDCSGCRNCEDTLAAQNPNSVRTEYRRTYRDNNMCGTVNDDECTIEINFNSYCAPLITHNSTHTCSTSGACRNKISSCERNYNFTANYVVRCVDGYSYLSSSSCSGSNCP